MPKVFRISSRRSIKQRVSVPGDFVSLWTTGHTYRHLKVASWGGTVQLMAMGIWKWHEGTRDAKNARTNPQDARMSAMGSTIHLSFWGRISHWPGRSSAGSSLGWLARELQGPLLSTTSLVLWLHVYYNAWLLKTIWAWGSDSGIHVFLVGTYLLSLFIFETATYHIA